MRQVFQLVQSHTKTESYQVEWLLDLEGGVGLGGEEVHFLESGGEGEELFVQVCFL